MTRRSLLEELKVRVLLCDGAMGTQLQLRGMKPGECGELWNVSRPDDVRAIHAAYASAGCELITTNSFGGSAVALKRHGLESRVAEVNLAAAKLARDAAGESRWALGDIGPLGELVEPYGDISEDDACDAFAAQAGALAEGGVDALLVETMADPNELAIAVRAAKSAASQLPVLATFTFSRAGGTFRTMMGTTVADAVAAAIDAGADVVGSNCGTSLSLDDYLDLAGELVKNAGKIPVILQPNAGSPREVNGRLVYDATPQDMARVVPRFLESGIRILGGCCGTTPDHLASMRAIIAS
jgi:5-methyltetrahydrofolate--homocysteine methyltransferase